MLVYWTDHFSKSPDFLTTGKVCWLHNTSENQHTLPLPRFGYGRILGEEMCINDPALGIRSQDFNPITCNLLRTTDQVSDKAETGVSSFKFTGTGLAFVPWFYFVLLSSVINKGGAQTLHKTLVKHLSDCACLLLQAYFVKVSQELPLSPSKDKIILALTIITRLSHKLVERQCGRNSWKAICKKLHLRFLVDMLILCCCLLTQG